MGALLTTLSPFWTILVGSAILGSGANFAISTGIGGGQLQAGPLLPGSSNAIPMIALWSVAYAFLFSWLLPGMDLMTALLPAVLGTAAGAFGYGFAVSANFGAGWGR